MIDTGPEAGKKKPKRLMSKLKYREDGTKYRIKPKIVYFEGTPYEIEDEIEAHSDSTASLETSDDDFTIDDDDVITGINQLLDKKQKGKPKTDKAQGGVLEQSLQHNVPKRRSLFGRK